MTRAFATEISQGVIACPHDVAVLGLSSSFAPGSSRELHAAPELVNKIARKTPAGSLGFAVQYIDALSRIGL